MKIKHLLALLFLSLSGLFAYGQDICQVSGIVRYKYNDYIGYRTDLGAEVYFIPVKSDDKIPHVNLWNEYELLASRGVQYYKAVAEAKSEGYYIESYINSLYGIYHFGSDEEKRLKELDSIIWDEEKKLKSNDDNVALVDNSGLYTINLPKGEYYVLFVSANRKRNIGLAEVVGRIHLTKIELKGASKKASYDFDY